MIPVTWGGITGNIWHPGNYRSHSRIEFHEMYRCREQSYCCGGGGGGMWLDGVTPDHTRERLSENRVKEAIEIGAEVLVVCCPYEVSRSRVL
ncbi:MAG: hypothetical protein Ct9H300mP28_02660 [Pseudomonadota bacterium]|nr:MAG: hypothetical protein Ct9H300mP28_02660 [Pseudomonadota bacterium]